MNNVIQSVDLSDNDLVDEHGLMICSYIQLRSEVRDLELWQIGLRQREAELNLKLQTAALNMNYVNMEERELDSGKQVRKLLKNLDNPEI